MDVSWKILVASSDVEIGQSLVTVLARLGLETLSASSLGECREVLAKQDVGLIFCGRRFRDGNYQDVMNVGDSLPRKNKARIVLTTAYIDPVEYHQARAAGVFDVIALPCHPTTIEWMVIQTMRDLRKWGDRPSLVRSGDNDLPKTLRAAATKS